MSLIKKTIAPITLFSSLMFMGMNAKADDDTGKQASWQGRVGVSVISQQLREESLHPLRNHGPVFSLEGVVSRRSESNSHEVVLHLPVGVLFDRYGLPAISVQYGLEGFGLWHYDQHFSFGYMATANARYRYFPEWDDSHLYWLTDYTLGPALHYRVQSYPQLSIQMGFGLASVISRSPQHPLNKFDNILTLSGFFGVPQQNFQFRHLGNFQTGTLRFDYDIGNSSHHSLHYEARLVRVDDALQFVEVWNKLGWRYIF